MVITPSGFCRQSATVYSAADDRDAWLMNLGSHLPLDPPSPADSCLQPHIQLASVLSCPSQQGSWLSLREPQDGSRDGRLSHKGTSPAEIHFLHSPPLLQHPPIPNTISVVLKHSTEVQPRQCLKEMEHLKQGLFLLWFPPPLPPQQRLRTMQAF